MATDGTALEIVDRFLAEKKLAEGISLLETTEIDRLRDEARKYFSAELLSKIAQSNLFRVPTIEDAQHLVQLQEALRSDDEEVAAELLSIIHCPIIGKNIAQKKFRRNDSDHAIIILRDEGNRNLVLATDNPEFETYKDAAKRSANKVMIIQPGSYGGINSDGQFIYGIDETILKNNFDQVEGDTWQTKPHSLVFATAPREFYGTPGTIATMQSHEGTQNAKPYQLYCHDDLKNPSKAYNADPERFTPVNDEARLLFEILQSAPAQLAKELREKIDQLI